MKKLLTSLATAGLLITAGCSQEIEGKIIRIRNPSPGKEVHSGKYALLEMWDNVTIDRDVPPGEQYWIRAKGKNMIYIAHTKDPIDEINWLYEGKFKLGKKEIAVIYEGWRGRNSRKLAAVYELKGYKLEK